MWPREVGRGGEDAQLAKVGCVDLNPWPLEEHLPRVTTKGGMMRRVCHASR